MNIGLNGNEGYSQSTNTLGRRYFTDLRFEQIENFNNALDIYINEFKTGN